MKAPRLASSGFTLVEIMVTSAVAMIVGGIIFFVLQTAMTLYAKNTAINSAHQQARAGVDQMLANVHGSVSIPRMIDAGLNPVPATDAKGSPTPAPGISMQLFEAGPFPVTSNADASDTSITLNSGKYVPKSNSRLNITPHNIELDVVSSSKLAKGNRKFNFATPIGTDVIISGSGDDGGEDGEGEGTPATYIITAIMTRRVSYAVIRTNPLSESSFIGELRYYPNNSLANYKVIARNIVSDKPFSVPLQPTGGLQNRFVAAVNLSTVEPQFTNRGYAAVNMFISSLIPFRCRLTTTQ